MEFWISLALVSVLWLYYQHKIVPKEKAEKIVYQAVADGARELHQHANKLKRKPCGDGFKTA
jgi:hypothetical protein